MGYAMLDAELYAAIAAANSAEAIAEMIPLIEPIDFLLESLGEGTATPLQQWRATQVMTDARDRGRPGRKPKAKMERDALLTMAAQDARRSMELWRRHYGKRNLPRAAEIACRRWLDLSQFSDADTYEAALHELSDRVLETLRRVRARNFGV